MLYRLCPVEANGREVVCGFISGRTNTYDAERSGQPNSTIIPENIKVSSILERSVFTISHKHLSTRKLCSKWVPRLLTVHQKQQRVDDSERCQDLFQRNKKDLSYGM